ncbi:NUDIX hydrolase [candidate division KSB1 bacterium]|nr:NUDIX hydrolase [candidate division KSB1 bacterium]
MKREYPDAPLVGVGIVIKHAHSVVLVERGQQPKMNVWTIPGGLIELGESTQEAAKREVLEECNLQIELGDIISVVDLIKKDDGGAVQYHYILIDFSATYLSGELCPASDAKDAKWVPIEELPSYDIPDITRKVIEKAFL